jgi:hypothetical protein
MENCLWSLHKNLHKTTSIEINKWPHSITFPAGGGAVYLPSAPQ